MPRMNRDQSVGWIKSLIWEDDMFVDRKPQSDPASMQCGLKTSAVSDRHGLDEMIFGTVVEIVYTLVSKNMAWLAFVT